MGTDLNSADADAAARAAALRAERIDALLDERRQAATFGRDDRVAAVDAELELAGHTAPAKRQPPPQQTAAPRRTRKPKDAD